MVGRWTCLLGLACALPGARTAHGQQDAPIVDHVRSLFPQAVGWFRIVSAARFDRAEDGGLIADLASLDHPRVRPRDGSGHTVLARFPASFGRSIRIGSGEAQEVFVELAPLEAADVPARIEDGIVVYPGVYEDTDVLFKSTPTHVDEYLLLRSEDAPARWVYQVRLGPGAARLRQAGDGVEVVDARGVAWLRATPPFAIDRSRRRVEGTLRVEGDRLIAAVDVSELSPPILVDPDWRSTGDMAYGRFFHESTLLDDGRVLSTGGCSASVCSGDLTIPECRTVVRAAEALDLATRTFSRLADGSAARFFHSAEHLPDGDVLLAGGCRDPECVETVDEVERFDAAGGAFEPAGMLPSGRAGIASAVLADGRVLLAGGCDRAGCTAESFLYDPVTEELLGAAPLRTARGRATATVLAGGQVLLAGGCTAIECGGVLDSVELYDPGADRFDDVAPLAVARGGHWAAPLLDGGAIVGGGCADSLCTTIHRSAERFDPVTRLFHPVGDQGRPRFGGRAALLPDGTVLVNQGCQRPAACDLSNEIFQPDLEAFAPVENAVTERAFHTLTVHPSGLVIANGGCQPGTCSWWVETWELAALGPDGGGADAGARDGGSAPDGAPVADAGSPDGAIGPPRRGGCGCNAQPVPEATIVTWLVAVAGIVAVRSRRRREQRR